jgi:hypothetical protein
MNGKYCRFENCPKSTKTNDIDGIPRCHLHRSKDAVLHGACVCGSGLIPNFTNIDGSKACGKCGKASKRNKYKAYCACETQATRKDPVTGVAYCAKCRPDLPNIDGKMCVDCGKHQPTFGPEGGHAIYCEKCNALEDRQFSNQRDKKCLDCGGRAYYTNEGKSPTHCGTCKKNYVNMVHTGARICSKKKCNTIASYQNVNTKSYYCTSCKPTDISTNRLNCYKCDECTAFAQFGFKGTKNAFKCSTHATDEHVAVIYPLCQVCENDHVANYGLFGGKLTACGKHITGGMVYKPRKRCVYKGCTEFASYGTHITSKRMHCDGHIQPGEKHYLEWQCNGDGCTMICHLNSDKLCHECAPEDSRKEVSKEIQVSQFLKERCNGDFIPWDKSVTKKVNGIVRPDFVLIYDRYIVVIEVDEYQHKRISKEDEILRMRKIYSNIIQADKERVIFIRFNPDTYSTDGVTRRTNMETRLNTLGYILDNIDEYKSNSLLSAVYLFYNGHADIDEVDLD